MKKLGISDNDLIEAEEESDKKLEGFVKKEQKRAEKPASRKSKRATRATKRK